jgi:DNA-binding MarR family transcriptional regulator
MQGACADYAGNLPSVNPVSQMQETTRPTTLIALFRRTAQLMVAELVERLAAAGYPDVPAASHPVFENIDPDGTRLTLLAARSDMTHQAMGELVDSLEYRGYVRRQPDPSDGRARLVSLTAKGRRMVRVARREIAEIEAGWSRNSDVAGLPPELRDGLEAAIERAESHRKVV